MFIGSKHVAVSSWYDLVHKSKKPSSCGWLDFAKVIVYLSNSCKMPLSSVCLFQLVDFLHNYIYQLSSGLGTSQKISHIVCYVSHCIPTKPPLKPDWATKHHSDEVCRLAMFDYRGSTLRTRS